MRYLTLIFIFICSLTINISAQTEVKLRDIECYNLGDGRYFCQDKEKKTPLQGKSRIIDGYTSQYMEADFKDGIPDGSWKMYKYNVLTEEYLYTKGILNGDYKEYYSDGTIKATRSYIDGKINGKYIKYGPNGKMESEKGFRNGLEDGADIVFDSEGNIRSETHYKDGKAEGKSVRNISSNAGDYVMTAFYKNGVYDGDYSEVYANGTTKIKGKYISGKKNGTWEYAKKDGKKIRTEEYANDDKIKETIYYTDGTVEVVRELKDGKKNGYERKYNYGDSSLKSELYYQDGELASAPAGKGAAPSSGGKPGMIKQTKQITSNFGIYIQTFYELNGKMEGEYTEQYTDGEKALKTKGQYANGMKQGLWVYMDRYGKKEKEENYVDNKLNGKKIVYNGQEISKIQTYKNDELDGEYEEYRYGKVYEKGTYINGRVEGKRTYFHKNGKPQTEEIIPRDPDGKRIRKEFYESGVLREESIRDGGRELERKEYFENGKLEYYRKDNGSGSLILVEQYDESGKKLK